MREYSCAIVVDGHVKCWDIILDAIGGASAGFPEEIKGVSNAVEVAVGSYAPGGNEARIMVAHFYTMAKYCVGATKYREYLAKLAVPFIRQVSK
jgi:hypothetical protein